MDISQNIVSSESSRRNLRNWRFVDSNAINSWNSSFLNSYLLMMSPVVMIIGIV